jgi:outer membrane translocation and assembly module TamA
MSGSRSSITISVARGLAILCLLLGSAGGSTAAEATVSIVGIDDRQVEAAVRTDLNLPVLLSVPNMTDEERDEVIATEKERLTALVRSFGYLDADIAITEADEPGSFAVSATLGVRYRIGWVAVSPVAGADLSPLRADLDGIIGRELGAAARADRIGAIESAVNRRLADLAYPRATIVERVTIRDVQMAMVGYDLKLDPGPRLVFGDVAFGGSYHADLNTLQAAVPFEAGDPFERSKLDGLRESLEKMERFRRIRVEIGDPPYAESRVPIRVDLRDRAPDPDELAARGATGRAVLAVAIGALAVRQLSLVSGGNRKRTARKLFDMVVLMLALAAGVFILDRVVSFI